MGAPISKNLAKNDFDVLGLHADNSIKPPDITMMPSGSIVSEFVSNCNPESTLVDYSTIDIEATKDVCQTLGKKGSICWMKQYLLVSSEKNLGA